jgi:dTDP-4-amino-4,6-dideoxygalactose transaminase
MGAVNKYEWIDIGSSFVPSELSCAILWAQLERADQILSLRRKHFQTYLIRLADLQERGRFQVSSVPENCSTNAHIFFLIFESDELTEFYENGLKRNGISAFSHYIPLHSSPAGLKYGKVASSMNVTDRIFKRLLRLPIWTDLRDEQIELVVSTLSKLIESCP